MFSKETKWATWDSEKIVYGKLEFEMVNTAEHPEEENRNKQQLYGYVLTTMLLTG